MNARADEIARVVENLGQHRCGSDFSLVDIRENKALIRIRGPCVACPASFITLRGELERSLQRRFPEVKAVEIIL